MKFAVIFVGILLVIAAPARQNHAPQLYGTIYGIAIDQAGHPAKRLGLTAYPLGPTVLATVLPYTRTNDAGDYRFEKVPLWGRYTVYADDEEAGYSRFSTGPANQSSLPEVEISSQHPKAELTVVIPPKAGFIHVHLTNQQTGAVIIGMKISVMSEEKPASPIYTMSCASNHTILVPPDRSVQLHITSDGFGEWSDSAGKGKLIHLASGAELNLDVQLEPAE